MTSRVLVTGSRDWPEDYADNVWERLAPHAEAGATLLHGGARGLDSLAAALWRKHFPDGAIEQIDAPWDGPCLGPHRTDPYTGKPWCTPSHRKPSKRGGGTYCPMAGHRRNQHMVSLEPVAAYAFILNGSRGALDCARRAETAGVPTTRIELDL